MLTISVLWVALAATVTMAAVMRRARSAQPEAVAETSESGQALTLVALICGVVLLAGFLFISKFLVSAL
jgi:hypothetical protein